MKRFLCVFVLIVCLVTLLAADIYVKQQVKTPAYRGQPEKTEIQEQWLGKNRIAHSNDGKGIIVDQDINKMFIINHTTKTSIELDLPVDMTTIMPDQTADVMKMLMDSMTVSVLPNGQTKRVGNWDTKGYDMVMNLAGMDIKMVFWATANPGFDWKSYTSLYAEIYKAQLRVGEDFVAEFNKIEGYPVEMETQAMGITVASSVVEIDPNKAAPADVYQVPSGYTEKYRLSPQEMLQR